MEHNKMKQARVFSRELPKGQKGCTRTNRIRKHGVPDDLNIHISHKYKVKSKMNRANRKVSFI